MSPLAGEKHKSTAIYLRTTNTPFDVSALFVQQVCTRAGHSEPSLHKCPRWRATKTEATGYTPLFHQGPHEPHIDDRFDDTRGTKPVGSFLFCAYSHSQPSLASEGWLAMAYILGPTGPHVRGPAHCSSWWVGLLSMESVKPNGSPCCMSPAVGELVEGTVACGAGQAHQGQKTGTDCRWSKMFVGSGDRAQPVELVDPRNRECLVENLARKTVQSPGSLWGGESGPNHWSSTILATGYVLRLRSWLARRYRRQES